MALSDPQGILATPLTIVERRDDETDVAAIADLVAQREAGRVIVGLPRMMDGSLGIQAGKVQGFTDQLIHRLPVPVEFRDERLTTVSAQRIMRERTTRKPKQKARDDAIAAAILLQSYLDEPKFPERPEES